MLIPVFTSQFQKDVKKAKKRNYNIDDLKSIMEKLVNEEELEPKHKDHALIGNFKSFRDCHISPDWLLIYSIDTEENKISFIRTGTHSDLFKK